jgi:hypothetical protein
MKKNNITFLTQDIEALIEWHYQILGKEITDADKKLFFEVIVQNNHNFPRHEHIELVLKAFFSAIHYGSVELKGTNVRSHAITFNEWIKGRETIRPVSKSQANPNEKPDDWEYDPDEPLPIDITKEKAISLLNALATWRGSNLEDWRYKQILPLPVGSANGWNHYIQKLKARAKGLA